MPGSPSLREVPKPAARPHLCTLLDISMGRPMFLDSRLKLGSKYSLGEMAVGLVGLAACCTEAWEGPTTTLSVQEGACPAPPSGPLPVVPPPPRAWLTPLWEECCWAIPRKDWNGVFPPKEKGWEPMRRLWATAPRLSPPPPPHPLWEPPVGWETEHMGTGRPPSLSQRLRPRPQTRDPSMRREAAGRRTWVYLCSSTCPGPRGAPCGCVSPAPRWWHCIPGEQGGHGGS